jgi:hypothetical protein
MKAPPKVLFNPHILNLNSQPAWLRAEISGDKPMSETRTLYDRLGGYDAINAVANNLLPRMMDDPGSIVGKTDLPAKSNC